MLTDRTVTIRASVADVEFELGLAVALVVAVIFLFLRNLPATIIPSLSVPLSLVGTLAVMYLLGFSLDNLSLMALTISTGFVVDDAIVMIENISRYVEAGEAPLAAALKGSEQIGFTIISLTVSLIAVLIPLLFMGDVVGPAVPRIRHYAGGDDRDLRHRLADPGADDVRQAAAPPSGRARSRFDLQAERGFNWIIGRYDRALNVVLDHQPLTLLVALATMAVTVLLYIVVPKGFFPVQDTGVLQGISVASQTVVLWRDGGTPAGAGGGDPQRPRCRQPELVHRRRRQQHDAEQRPVPDQPEAEGRAHAERDRDRPAAAAGNGRGAGRVAVSAAGAGPDDRCLGQPHAVPVRAGEPEPVGVHRVGAEAAGETEPVCRTWTNVASDLQQQG